jgi:hypothetical protein
MSKSESNSGSIDQNGSDTTDESTVGDRLPAGATRIGIDEEGRIHYWHRAGEEMLVVELSADLSTRLERIDVSPGAEFHSYLENADEVCGWDHLSYDENWLGAALGGL